MELDHVLIAVTDLEAAAHEFERHGLASVEGGRHLAWGTANRIVPLGSSYIELIAVVDEAVAADSAFGRWVAGGASPVGRPLGWVVRPGNLDDVADRLGLTVNSGSRATPSGDVVRWRSAGVDEAIAEPCLPFFIEWGEGVSLPGIQLPRPATISRLVLEGNADRLTGWLGQHSLPIRVIDGPAEVAAVVLSTSAGEIIL